MKKSTIAISSFLLGAIMMTVGSAYAEDGLQQVSAFVRTDLSILVNGKPTQLSNSVLSYGGKTYLYLRDMETVAGIKVGWNPVKKEINVETNGVVGSGGTTNTVQPLPPTATESSATTPVTTTDNTPATTTLKFGETFDHNDLHITVSEDSDKDGSRIFKTTYLMDKSSDPVRILELLHVDIKLEGNDWDSPTIPITYGTPNIMYTIPTDAQAVYVRVPGLNNEVIKWTK